MQDKNKIENKKKLLQIALGNIVKKHRNSMKKGINVFSYEYDIGNNVISSTENGNNDARLSTVWKFANAYGMKCSDFIRLIEQELPNQFNFYDD